MHDDDELMWAMSFMSGILTIQFAYAIVLDEAGIVPKHVIADLVRSTVKDGDPDSANIIAMRIFVDSLDGKITPDEMSRPDWLRGVINGGKDSDNEA